MRLIITMVRANGGTTILLPSGTLGDKFYYNYNNLSDSVNNPSISNSYLNNLTKKIKRKIKELGYIRFLFILFKNFFRVLHENLITVICNFLEYKIYPLLIIGKTLPIGKLLSRDITGFSDYTFVFNEMEHQAVKTVFSSIKNLRLVKHPIVNYCKQKNNMNYLLVIIGLNVCTDLSTWINAIKTILTFRNISQIHLRFHPRSRKDSINYFEEQLNLNGIIFSTIDSTTVSIIDNICNYAGVLSSPSGALKIFRWATNNTFAFCLEDVAKEGNYGRSLIIGDSSGIIVKNDKMEIEEHDFYPPENLYFNNYPNLLNTFEEIIFDGK